MSRLIIVVMAGPIISRRLRGQGQWRICMHEAAHAYLAVFMGLPLSEASIVATKFTAGHVSIGNPPAVEPPEVETKCESDRRKIARLALMAVDDSSPLCRWRAALVLIRQCQKFTAAMIEDHWRAIELFACDLQEKGCIGGAEATAAITALLDAKRAFDAGEPFVVRHRWRRVAA
jgi:hypothetical protein